MAADYNAIFRSDNIHRRLFDGPRSCLWEHQNQREVVCHRETVAYKCSRTEGGNVGSTVAPEKSKFENNIPEYGQLYSGGLSQPQGGHSLPRASPGGTTTLELVHSAQPIHDSISCSRENQCGCRSRVKRIYRQQRLENRPDNHFSLSEGLLHRPVCVTSDASTCQIHQLEVRPPAFQSEAFSVNWKHLQGYAFPPFNLIARIPDKVMIDKTDLVLVAPIWQAQPWWPLLLGMLVQQPVLLPSS